MAQTSSLIAVLKKQLKLHGKTYKDVAVALDMSEASIKRLFIDHSFSLQRLEMVCQLIGLQLSDLVLLMQKDQPQLDELSEMQEKDLVNDPLLLMITIHVMNKHTFEDLCEMILVSATECIRKLAQLDRLRIIELLPNNRIKLLISPNFRWRLNGPIQQFFQTHVENDFFRSTFKAGEEKLLVLNGSLSELSNKAMQKKLDKLAKEFNELMQEDSVLPKEQKKNITIILASRAWQFSLFDQFRRKA